MYTNNYKYHILFYFPFILISSCFSQRDLTKEGVVQLISRDYDNTKRDFIIESFMPDMNIWFKGDFVIEEIKTIKTTDSNGFRTRQTPVAYYLFIDRKSKAFYNYSSFSDTAAILDKYIQEDTVEIKGLGGWSFYRSRNLNITDSLRRLSDTTINNIVYGRVQLILKSSNRLLTPIAYLRCDKKGTTFLFDKNLSEKLGCPIVRLHNLPTSKNPKPVSTEIVFVRDSLSKAELKVFHAWEKNLKKYPVNK